MKLIQHTVCLRVEYLRISKRRQAAGDLGSQKCIRRRASFCSTRNTRAEDAQYRIQVFSFLLKWWKKVRKWFITNPKLPPPASSLPSFSPILSTARSPFPHPFLSSLSRRRFFGSSRNPPSWDRNAWLTPRNVSLPSRCLPNTTEWFYNFQEEFGKCQTGQSVGFLNQSILKLCHRTMTFENFRAFLS